MYKVCEHVCPLPPSLPFYLYGPGDVWCIKLGDNTMEYSIGEEIAEETLDQSRAGYCPVAGDGCVFFCSFVALPNIDPLCM